MKLIAAVPLNEIIVSVSIVVLLAVVAAFGGIALYQLRRLQHQQLQLNELRSRLSDSRGELHDDLDDFTGRETPNPPRDLIEACRNGTCVLFAGNGISRSDTRDAILNQILYRATLSEDMRDTIRRLAQSNIDAAFETLIAEEGRHNVLEWLNNASGGWGGHSTVLESLLAEISFEDCVTTTYDETWAVVFQHRKPVIITGSSSDDYETAANPAVFSVTNMLGVVSAPDSIRLTWQDLRSYVYANPTFGKYIGSLFQTATVLFLGCSTALIEGVLSSIPELAANTTPTRTHYALIPSERNLQANTRRFRPTFGIEILPYRPSKGHPQVLTFVGRLLEETHGANAETGSILPRSAPPRLNSVRLKNIGSFESLDLSFDGDFTIIIGDNGFGKSTILRAIAVALASGDPAAATAAQRLLTNGANDGFIELHLGRQIYRVDLVRSRGAVNLTSQQLSPLRRGGLVALGFPAVRGVSVSTIPGFVPRGEHRSPSVADVLPLAWGNQDGRLNDVHQWLINVDFIAGGGSQWTSHERDRATALRASFFKILAEIVPYTGFEFSRVVKDPWRVMVKMRDGEASLDQVSQGMSSVLSWVGTLLQRMYEIYWDSENPEAQRALALIDELDAHLHPAWQRQMPGLLRKHFPNVTFIATTHSPLIVSALAEADVRIARRNAHGKLVVERAIETMTGLRADQVLTSDAFDLESTRSPEHDAKRFRLNELIALPSLTPEQRDERREIEDELSKTTIIGDDRARRAEFERLRQVALTFAQQDPGGVRDALEKAAQQATKQSASE